jgi:acetyl-CoA carboxylase biotin carboxyl carrier protein
MIRTFAKRRMLRGEQTQGTRVSNSFDAIKRVIDAFEKSEWSEIDVRTGDLRVHLATGGRTAELSSDTSRATDRPISSPEQTAPPATTVGAETPLPSDARIVESPSPGIFWRSPEPGAPPFADVGRAVDTADTVCIIEVMKLMNHVKAGVSGEVIAVYGENGVAVQKGQPLFAIAPSGSSS